MRPGGFQVLPCSGLHLRSLAVAAFSTFFLFACAGTGGPTAIPEQEWSPDPVPARPAVPDASSLDRTTGKTIMKWPNATYETIGAVQGISIPDFELPTTGGGTKSVRSPAPVETAEPAADSTEGAE